MTRVIFPFFLGRVRASHLAAIFHPQYIQHRLGKNSSADPNCSCLTPKSPALLEELPRCGLFKVIQCDQTSAFASPIILRSEEVRRPLQGQVPHCKRRYKLETIFIVLVVLFLLGGGGWGYSRRRG